ncbi:hydroxymethylglutaryl-CoA reductase, degradative [Candidatus Dependentiae bacterium]|nr:hydroxymethylglutaryl-CoA reductase, degradative [Candidatus Dependentiae bacterium]
MIGKTSSINGFYKKTQTQRLKVVQDFSSLSKEECSLLQDCRALDFDRANRMIENVVSSFPVPLGIALHFLINEKNYFVPMAIEESSVVAAASYAAKLARHTGGFSVTTTNPIMIGQVQLKNISDGDHAILAIESAKQELLALANSCDPVLISVGGGACDIMCRYLATDRGAMLIVHLMVDVQDAMGANIVNVMGEKITRKLEAITGGRAGLRIVSNLTVNRMVHARVVWPCESIGSEVIESILDAYEWACVDPFRCATHNKGIMNGIDAVALATGNDFRAIEAGAHAYASLASNGYAPLTSYEKDANGNLVGELELPLAVGMVGGITQCHPVAKICLKILGVETASELACVMGAVGLAQNFAALRALVSEGISKGHMRLHSKNIAMAAGAPREFVDSIAKQMIDEGDISVSRARALVSERNTSG